MDSKLQDVQLSPSMRSNQGEPSAPKKIKSLTLFEDLLNNPDTDKVHHVSNLEAHDEKDSSTSDNRNSWLSHLGFNRFCEDSIVHQSIRRNLISSLNSGGFHVQVDNIYKNGHSSPTGRAKLQSFGMYRMAVKEKCGGNPNINWAWYGASKNEINGILSHGFSLPLNNGMYGRGFYFSTAHHPLESLRFSTVDADGLRHMLLCRIILGKVEVITPGFGQHNPSSEEFDSGVDKLVRPRNFIIWNANVNTRVLPEFVISFRTSSNVLRRIPQTMKLPNSDWIPAANLINGLSNVIPGSARKLLAKYLNDYEKNEITRETMIHRIRLIVGDRLLRTMIRSFGEKVKASSSSIQSPKRGEEADFSRSTN